MAVINITNDKTILEWKTEFNSLATFTGDISALTTTEQTLVGGINELDSEAADLRSDIGTFSSLNVDIRETDLVVSINNFYDAYELIRDDVETRLASTETSISSFGTSISTNTTNISTNTTNISTNTSSIGTITNLTTAILNAVDPDNLVQAINYVHGVATDEAPTFTGTATFDGEATFNDVVTTTANVNVGANLDVDGDTTLDNTEIEGYLLVSSSRALATGDVTPSVGDFTHNVLSGTAYISIGQIDTGKAVIAAHGTGTNNELHLNPTIGEVYINTTKRVLTTADEGSGNGIDADTVDGLEASAFHQATADGIFNNDKHLQFGDGTSGSVKFEHISGTNLFSVIPHNGSDFQTSQQLTYGGSEGYWTFAGRLDVDGALNVAGGFTSLGIDDNATSEKIDITNSLISISVPTTIAGTLTISTGNIVVPATTTTQITNSAGEYFVFNSSGNRIDVYAGTEISAIFATDAVSLYGGDSIVLATKTDGSGIDITGVLVATGAISGTTGSFSGSITSGSNVIVPVAAGSDFTNESGELLRLDGVSNVTQLFAGGVKGIEVTANEVDLNYGGSTKLTTTTSGVNVTGSIVTTGGLTLGNTGVIDNGSNERIEFTTSTIVFDIGNTEVFRVDTAGVDVTGALTVTGAMSGNSLTVTGALSGSNLTLGNTGVIDNGSNERIEFTTSTIVFDIGNTEVFRVDTAGVDVTGALTTTGGIIATGALSGSNLTLGNTGVIDNGSTERIEFTTSTIVFDVNNVEKLRVDTAGVDVTGALTVTEGLTLGNTGVIDNGSSERIEFTTSTIIMDIGNTEVFRIDSAGVDVTGALTTTGNISAYSDISLKQNLSVIDKPLEKLNRITGYHYDWNEEALSIGMEERPQVGVIAQDVMNVLPEAVTQIGDYQGVDYNKLIPLLIESIKELEKQVMELKGNK